MKKNLVLLDGFVDYVLSDGFNPDYKRIVVVAAMFAVASHHAVGSPCQRDDYLQVTPPLKAKPSWEESAC